MDAQKLQKTVKTITALATLFVFLLISIIVAEYIKIGSLNNKIDNITTEIDNLSQTETTLKNNMEYHSSSTYIEDYARRELRMLDDGEVYIVFE